jgi:cell division protein ZapA
VAARQTVPVRILGQEYRIRSDGDPESVVRAARLLEETMERVRGRSSTVDSLDVAVLAALNLAHHLMGLREGRTGREPGVEAERVTALADLVASALGGAASP